MTSVYEEVEIQIEDLSSSTSSSEATASRTKYNKNILKLLSNYIYTKTEEYERTSSLIKREESKTILNVLTSVRDMIINGKFTNESNTILIQTYLNTNCDLSATAKELSSTNSAIRKRISRVNTILHEFVSDDFFTLVENNDTTRLKMFVEISINGKGVDKILSYDLLKYTPDPSTDVTIKLTECVYELRLLKLYALATIDKNIAKADWRKLSHLLAIIMNGQSMYDYERSLVTSYLQETLTDDSGNIVDFDGFMQMIAQMEL